MHIDIPWCAGCDTFTISSLCIYTSYNEDFSESSSKHWVSKPNGPLAKKERKKGEYEGRGNPPAGMEEDYIEILKKKGNKSEM